MNFVVVTLYTKNTFTGNRAFWTRVQFKIWRNFTFITLAGNWWNVKNFMKLSSVATEERPTADGTLLDLLHIIVIFRIVEIQSWQVIKRALILCAFEICASLVKTEAMASSFNFRVEDPVAEIARKSYLARR